MIHGQDMYWGVDLNPTWGMASTGSLSISAFGRQFHWDMMFGTMNICIDAKCIHMFTSTSGIYISMSLHGIINVMSLFYVLGLYHQVLYIILVLI